MLLPFRKRRPGLTTIIFTPSQVAFLEMGLFFDEMFPVQTFPLF